MAKRPIFIAKDKYPFYTEKTIEFEYFAGFSASQKQKSINSLHNSYKEQGGGNVLEISTKEVNTNLNVYFKEVKCLNMVDHIQIYIM